MGKIKIEDLPQDTNVSTEEMRAVFGGYIPDTKHTWAYEIGGATHKDSWKGE